MAVRIMKYLGIYRLRKRATFRDRVNKFRGASFEKERLDQKDDKFMERVMKLKRQLTKSIIQCGLGGGCASYIEATDHGLHPENSPTNLDMAWVPFHGAWFCTKCCENLIKGDKILRNEKHPDYMRHLRESGFL